MPPKIIIFIEKKNDPKETLESDEYIVYHGSLFTPFLRYFMAN